jgi:hypothetical protein
MTISLPAKEAIRRYGGDSRRKQKPRAARVEASHLGRRAAWSHPFVGAPGCELIGARYGDSLLRP